MLEFFANIFGYLLNFLYNFVGNYGLAIIFFSLIVKVILMPLSYRQQKTAKKTMKLQKKMEVIKAKYSKDPEKMNKEIMELYKQENMSPFSGCFSAIIQIILLFSVFYLVRSPLTHMKKVDQNLITKYTNIIKEENLAQSSAYPEIVIIREIQDIKQLNRSDVSEDELNKLSLNMNFLGIDLSQIPTKNMNDWKTLIIPILYVISSFVSIKLNTALQPKREKNEDNDENKEEKEDAFDAMAQANKSMTMMMPILSISIAIVAPLGLALYWLMNNVLMIVERLLFTVLLKDEEENQNA